MGNHHHINILMSAENPRTTRDWKPTGGQINGWTNWIIVRDQRGRTI